LDNYKLCKLELEWYLVLNLQGKAFMCMEMMID